MFRVARKIRVGRETGNTHIFFLALAKHGSFIFSSCYDFYSVNSYLFVKICFKFIFSHSNRQSIYLVILFNSTSAWHVCKLLT